MIVGKFGIKTFEVSEKRLVTFNGISVNLGIEFENQNVENSKPSTWVKGKKLKSVMIPITLDHRFCNIKDEMTYWETAMDKVSGGNLSIGAWTIGYFIITDIKYPSYKLGNNGRYLKVEAEITLQEFVSKGYNKDKASATTNKTTVTTKPTTATVTNNKAEEVKKSNVEVGGAAGRRTQVDTVSGADSRAARGAATGKILGIGGAAIDAIEKGIL